jgi:hypothetical protein
MATLDFGFLSHEFPNDADAIARLNSFFSHTQADPSHKTLAFGIPRIYEITHPCSQPVLVRILTRLVDLGMLKELFRVASAEAGLVWEFSRFEEIPPTLFDTLRGEEVAVDPKQIRLFYQLNC